MLVFIAYTISRSAIFFIQNCTMFQTMSSTNFEFSEGYHYPVSGAGHMRFSVSGRIKLGGRGQHTATTLLVILMF
jgi:hypothetical protein